MLCTAPDAIAIPDLLVRRLDEHGMKGHLSWVTPRLLAELARRPFRLLRRGWKLSTQPFGYVVGGRGVGQFLLIERESGQAVLETRSPNGRHRIVVSLQGQLLTAGAV